MGSCALQFTSRKREKTPAPPYQHALQPDSRNNPLERTDSQIVLDLFPNEQERRKEGRHCPFDGVHGDMTAEFSGKPRRPPPGKQMPEAKQMLRHSVRHGVSGIMQVARKICPEAMTIEPEFSCTISFNQRLDFGGKNHTILHSCCPELFDIVMRMILDKQQILITYVISKST